MLPSQVVLHEWTDHYATCPGAATLLVGEVPVPRIADDLFHLRFQNRLGRATVRALDADGGEIARLHVEVISRKFASVEAYTAYLQALLEDLFALSTRLPFALDEVTASRAAASAHPPTDFMLMHLLLRYGDELVGAADRILRRPHERLDRQPVLVPLAHVTEAGPDELLDAVGSPERWVQVPAERLALAARLGGHAPKTLWQNESVESFDTAENRFARAFLSQLAEGAARLTVRPWWAAVATRRQQRIAGLGRALERAVRHPVFRTVGAMRHVPLRSNVLRKREGYRELFALWRQLQTGRQPLFEAADLAIDLRDAAKLYEVWAFYALVERIGAALGVEPQLRQQISRRTGLHRQAVAVFGAVGRLDYDRTVASYSTDLRPDFLWRGVDGVRVAFDAKFRVGNTAIGAVISSDGLDPEDTASSGQPELDADAGGYPAIGTMHHYRDALGLSAAFVVYPGTINRHYAPSGTSSPTVDLATILHGDVEGVGALGMSPATIEEQTA